MCGVAFGRRTSRRLSPSSVQMFTTTQHFTGFVYTQESHSRSARIVRLKSRDGRASGHTIVFGSVIFRRRRHGAGTASFPGTKTRAEPHVAEPSGSSPDEPALKASMDATNAKAMGLAMAMKLAKALLWKTWSLREVGPSSMRADASTASTFLSASCPMKPHQVEVTHSPAWIGVAATWVEHFSSVEVTMAFPGRHRNRRPGPAF